MQIKAENIKTLPETSGIIELLDKKQKPLFIGIVRNFKAELPQIFSEIKNLKKDVYLIEVSENKKDFIKKYCRKIREHEPKYNLPIVASPRYPLLKITNEKFPKMLATRKVLSEKDEYFGAFLPETGVRMWLSILNRIFRLRNCTIEIDGEFERPCSLYFSKKCVAPCVSELCSKKEYEERVEALKLFLSGDEKHFADFVKNKISVLSEELNFETASVWRDLLDYSRKIYYGKKTHLWLDDALDTFYLEQSEDDLKVYLVTTRGRKFLGNKEFIFDKNYSNEFVLSQILWQFYEFHAPKEIRVTSDFYGREFLSEALSDSFGRRVKVSVVEDKLTPTAIKNINRAKQEYSLEKIGKQKSFDEIAKDLKKIFGLRKKPKIIEAFDVAHISNVDFVAASAVWESGDTKPEKSQFWLSEEENEPDSLARSVGERFLQKPFPDLLLIDGGLTQLRAVKEIFTLLKIKDQRVISAVKPAGKHNKISHFLTADEKRIEFLEGDPVFELLRNLRDEAHDTANKIHRQHRANKRLFENERIFIGLSAKTRRELLQKFGSVRGVINADGKEIENFIGQEKAAKLRENIDSDEKDAQTVIPLVPIKFTETGGAADDLQPIENVKFK